MNIPFDWSGLASLLGAALAIYIALRKTPGEMRRSDAEAQKAQAEADRIHEEAARMAAERAKEAERRAVEAEDRIKATEASVRVLTDQVACLGEALHNTANQLNTVKAESSALQERVADLEREKDELQNWARRLVEQVVSLGGKPVELRQRRGGKFEQRSN
ncbi:MAG: hypothetical protein ACKOC5_07620 [Chloroflexota bacterium]